MSKKISILIIFFISFLFIYFILISEKCRSISNLKVNGQFNKTVIKSCINSISIKDNIKTILSKNKYLFEISLNLKNTFFPNFGKENLLKSKENLKKIYFKEPIKIKGIINNENILKKLSVKNPDIKNYNNWFRSHGNNYNNKYLKAQDINSSSVENLVLKRKINTLENLGLKGEWESRIGINPIFAEGKIIFVTAAWELVAISAEDFSLVWAVDFDNTISKRGFVYHKEKGDDKGYIFVNSGINLYKLDPQDGSYVKEFGNSGSVEVGIVLIPPVIFENQIIVSNVTKGEITSVNLKTGVKNFEKYLHEKSKDYFYANPWGGAALDNKNGIYFVVTGNPKPEIIGIDRPGENKNSCSIIAFDLKTEKILWTFQDVKHDLWDFDIAAPPVLAEIKIEDYLLEVVIITTKTGNTYIFERKTGRSLFDINYKKTQPSNIPSEIVSPYQPEPIIPKKFSKIEFKKEDLRNDLKNDEIFLKKFDENHVYGWFQPPTIGKDVIFYGLVGGNNWVGSAFDPISQNLFVPSNHVPYKIKTIVKSSEKEKNVRNLKYYSLYKSKCADCHGSTRNGKYVLNEYDTRKEYIPSLVGLTIFEDLNNKIKNYTDFMNMHKVRPDITEDEYKDINKLLINWDNNTKNSNSIYFEGQWEKALDDNGNLISSPPWGSISSINVSTGNTNWKKPFGFLGEKEVGLFNYGGVSVLSSNLLVATGTTDQFATIIDTETGNTLWKYKMDGEGTAAPLLYNYKNKTYIAILATGGLTVKSNRVSQLYVFALK